MGKNIKIKESQLLESLGDILGDAIPQLVGGIDGIDLTVTIPAIGKNILELNRTNNKVEKFYESFDISNVTEENIEELEDLEESLKVDFIDLVQRIIESLPGSYVGSATSFGATFLMDMALEKFIEKGMEFSSKYVTGIKVPLLNNVVQESLTSLKMILETKELIETTSSENSELNEAVMNSPVTYKYVSSKFHEQREGYKHHGVDLACASGTKIYAPLPGVIVAKGSKDTGYHSNKCGGTIRIKHGNSTYTRYCHVKKIMPEFMEDGAPVPAGSVIGLTGGGDNDPYKGSSTGAHLHFEMKVGGRLVDPLKYIGKESDGRIPDEGLYSDEDMSALGSVLTGGTSSGFGDLFFSALEKNKSMNENTIKLTEEDLYTIVEGVIKDIDNDIKDDSRSHPKWAYEISKISGNDFKYIHTDKYQFAVDNEGEYLGHWNNKIQKGYIDDIDNVPSDYLMAAGITVDDKDYDFVTDLSEADLIEGKKKGKSKKSKTTLCSRGKSAAKSKFDVYPSAYANGYAVQVCKGQMPGLDGKKRCSGKFCKGKKKK